MYVYIWILTTIVLLCLLLLVILSEIPNYLRVQSMCVISRVVIIICWSTPNTQVSRLMDVETMHKYVINCVESRQVNGNIHCIAL